MEARAIGRDHADGPRYSREVRSRKSKGKSSAVEHKRSDGSQSTSRSRPAWASTKAKALTPAARDAIINAIAAGVPPRAAAAAAGISPNLLDRWLRVGREIVAALEGGQPWRSLNAHERACFDLLRHVEGAIGRAETRGVLLIAKAGDDVVVNGKVVRTGDWRAPAWLLERRFPERWAVPTQRLAASEHEGGEGDAGAGDPVQELVALLDAMATRRMKKKAAAEAAATSTPKREGTAVTTGT